MDLQRLVIKASLLENIYKKFYLLLHFSFHDLSTQFQNFIFKESASEANSFKNKALTSQRQAVKAWPHKNVNKSFLLYHAPQLLQPAFEISEPHYFKGPGGPGAIDQKCVNLPIYIPN